MIVKSIPEFISFRKKPINLKLDDTSLFEHEYQQLNSSANIYSLKYILVFRSSIFQISTFKFLNSFTHNYHISKRTNWITAIKSLRGFGFINKSVWIIDNWSGGYFHWFADALPRLIASFELLSNHVVLIPKEFQQFGFIIDSLDILKQKYRFIENTVFVRKLLLPSHVSISGNYNIDILNQLRLKFKIKDNTNSFRKVYISRNKSQKRKILNESDFVLLLSEFNYEIVYLEEFTLIQQIELMQQTKTIIGLHGAGLTNMLFMPKNSNVVELRNLNDAHNNCYFSLASDLDMNYYYEQCIGTSTNTHFTDVTVSLESIRIILEEISA